MIVLLPAPLCLQPAWSDRDFLACLTRPHVVVLTIMIIVKEWFHRPSGKSHRLADQSGCDGPSSKDYCILMGV